MIILLPLFIVLVLADSVELAFLVAFGAVPVLIWFILSRGEEDPK